MKQRAVLVLLALAGPAAADPVRCVDASGKVHYVDSSAQGNMKCEPLRGSASVGVGEGRVKPAPTPAAKGTPAVTDEQRRSAIARAEQQLEEAKKALAEQEATREGGEKNYARVEERLEPYRDAVERAERNLQDARNWR